LAVALVAVVLVAAGVWWSIEAKPCDGRQPCPPRAPSADAGPTDASSPTSGDGPAVITAAGDIADPVPTAATQATGRLITEIDPAVALTLGDNQYPGGELSDFLTGYDTSWGSFLAKTRPAIGNHEYESSSGAEGYFEYFGDRSPGNYYSFDVGTWHVISLDSNCDHVGGCTPGTPQYEWLRADLATNSATCTLAFWHHPRWSSGTEHGNSTQVAPFIELLYDTGADVVLSGHEHNYERYAPQDPAGELDTERGIVQFVVGTGGHSLYPLGEPDANSVARSSTTAGVLQMTLYPEGYDFSFEPVLDGTFTDAGSGRCH
jgi:acid phosphatase type 7